MIRRAEPADMSCLRPESEASIRIRCLWEAYGSDKPFVQFWRTESGGVISCMDGQAIAAVSENENFEELAAFFSLQTDWSGIRTDEACAVRLAEKWSVPVSTGVVMTPGCVFRQEKQPLLEQVSPRVLYPLLAAVFGGAMPPFEAWYIDVSHRMRHGFCRTMAIAEEGETAACAMTVAECAGAALIGSVATQEKSRGKGYASRCVTALAAALQDEGKRVLLSPKNEPAKRLYERLGFIVCGKWGVVKRPE